MLGYKKIEYCHTQHLKKGITLDKDCLILQEGCDCFYEDTLTREDVFLLIQDLQAILRHEPVEGVEYVR